jgi:hypothetical protein
MSGNKSPQRQSEQDGQVDVRGITDPIIWYSINSPNANMAIAHHRLMMKKGRTSRMKTKTKINTS